MMKNHIDFILSPLTDIFEEGLTASRYIPLGIVGYPLVEYILPSIFLRMTGAQEQKLRCICWEIATVDYEYRRNFLQSQQLYGEYSSLDQKKKVYKDLVNQIFVREKFDLSKYLNVNDVISQSINAVKEGFDQTFIMESTKREYMYFCSDFSKEVKSKDIAVSDSLFKGKVEQIYGHLFDHRNRTAHNTRSYQSDLPDFRILKSAEHKYDNYYFYFTILLIIDKIFTGLFRKFMEYQS